MTNPPTKLKPLQLPKGLTVTAEAHPKEVQNALCAIHGVYTQGRSTPSRHRASILKMAVASVAEGCTSVPQYRRRLEDKYGKDMVETYHVPLRRIIKNDLDIKAGLGTMRKRVQQIDPHIQRARNNGKWFADPKTKRLKHAKLNLPPVDRKEPPFRNEDVAEYQELIKHLDPYSLRTDEYIKHCFHPYEQQPDRWNKRIPRMAMREDLRSKGASEDMVAHLESVYIASNQSVSYCSGWLVAPQMALTQGKQSRKRQASQKSSTRKTLAAKIVEAKALTASPSHFSPH